MLYSFVAIFPIYVSLKLIGFDNSSELIGVWIGCIVVATLYEINDSIKVKK